MKKSLRKNLGNKRGFTLVELIVVMIVIAILAMMLIPQMASFRTRSEQSTCKANLRMLDSIDGMWCGLNVKNLPGGKNVDPTFSTEEQQSYLDAGLIKKIYSCPTDGQVYKWEEIGNNGTYRCLDEGDDPEYPHRNED